MTTTAVARVLCVSLLSLTMLGSAAEQSAAESDAIARFLARQDAPLTSVRVPMQLDSTAQVRIAGPSSLTMTYQYEMVNGVDVVGSH